ncbi:hypothetical protein [uncultured Chryseobacterium sp.]|uniref:hypothetical protein n=1 Tax=uncultured Chryseobacterium sp. TaxID=259322 RepID=UPI0025D40241|nr:hypothetical protein [uncultured Chryseobacterium sp.]
MTRNNLTIKNLIKKYLTQSIRLQFNMDIDLKGEYTFTQNIVSKKTIIAATFSEKILSKPGLKLFLMSLITEINNERCSMEFILDRVKSLQNFSPGNIRLA